jgi:hypothetical protein
MATLISIYILTTGHSIKTVDRKTSRPYVLAVLISAYTSMHSRKHISALAFNVAQYVGL